MSRRFKEKTCVYCGLEQASSTGDHVFAREFLPVEHRANLPQVPACIICNGEKSKLEHYLLTLLPFAGHHPASSELLSNAVPKRLAKNQKLHRQLSAGRGKAFIEYRGVIRPSMTLPFDGEKLAKLFVLVARGMTAHSFGAQIPQSYYVGAGILTEHGEQITRPLLAGNANARVKEALGDELIEYEGAQAIDNACLTVWKFRLYGGMMFDDPESKGTATPNIWAVSAPRSLPGLFAGY